MSGLQPTLILCLIHFIGGCTVKYPAIAGLVDNPAPGDTALDCEWIQAIERKDVRFFRLTLSTSTTPIQDQLYYCCAEPGVRVPICEKGIWTESTSQSWEGISVLKPSTNPQPALTEPALTVCGSIKRGWNNLPEHLKNSFELDTKRAQEISSEVADDLAEVPMKLGNLSSLPVGTASCVSTYGVPQKVVDAVRERESE